MMTQPMMQQIIDRMLARAASDAAFKALCFTQPGNAFLTVAGEPLPARIQLRFVPVRPGELLVAMASPGDGSAVLEEKELDAVVGGAGTGDEALKTDWLLRGGVILSEPHEIEWPRPKGMNRTSMLGDDPK